MGNNLGDIMKTAIIHQKDYSIYYFIVDGDLTKFHGTCIGSCDNEELEIEYSSLICSNLGGGCAFFKDEIFINIDQFKEYIVKGAELIETSSY